MEALSGNYKLQVDVNGDQVFIVDKSIMESFSPRLSRSLTSTTGQNPNQLKVTFDDFPGGGEGFELATRFCYSKGKFPITPSNFVLLHCAAQFLEIGGVDRFAKCVEEIGNWSWSDLVSGLKQCQIIDSISNSRFSALVPRKVMESVVARISLPVAPSRPSSSSATSRYSCCSMSSNCTTSFRSYCSPSWWFRALVFLKPDSVVELVRLMVREKSSDHSVIFKFVVFHLKSNVLVGSGSNLVTNNNIIIDNAVDMFSSLLDRDALSCKDLFDVLRIVVSCSRSCDQSRVKLETLIGSRLDDGASLDELLVPYQGILEEEEENKKTTTTKKKKKKRYMYYDVNFVMRLVNAFLIQGRWVSPTRLRKVVKLVDAYIREVAPDLAVGASEFEALVTILPDSGRECSDGLYQAIDIYLEAHVCDEEEKLRICSALNRGKLSAEASRQLVQNPRFPSMAAIDAFVAQRSKLSHGDVTYYYCKRSKSGIFGRLVLF